MSDAQTYAVGGGVVDDERAVRGQARSNPTKECVAVRSVRDPDVGGSIGPKDRRV